MVYLSMGSIFTSSSRPISDMWYGQFESGSCTLSKCATFVSNKYYFEKYQAKPVQGEEVLPAELLAEISIIPAGDYNKFIDFNGRLYIPKGYLSKLTPDREFVIADNPEIKEIYVDSGSLKYFNRIIFRNLPNVEKVYIARNSFIPDDSDEFSNDDSIFAIINCPNLKSVGIQGNSMSKIENLALRSKMYNFNTHYVDLNRLEEFSFHNALVSIKNRYTSGMQILSPVIYRNTEQ